MKTKASLISVGVGVASAAGAFILFVAYNSFWKYDPTNSQAPRVTDYDAEYARLKTRLSPQHRSINSALFITQRWPIPRIQLVQLSVPKKSRSVPEVSPPKKTNEAGGESKTETPLTKPEDFRTWTANKGFQIEAQCVSRDNDVITLKRTNGKILTVHIGILSKTDLDYLNGRPNDESKGRINGGDATNGKILTAHIGILSKTDLDYLNGRPNDESKGRTNDGDAKGGVNPEVNDTTSLPQNITPTTVESLAKSRRTAKEALQVYQTLLADESFSDESKQAAKSRLSYWENLAAKDHVRLGTTWMSSDDASAAQFEAAELVGNAFTQLKSEKESDAKKSLEKARLTDPEATDALYVLGLVFALKDRNYQKAKPYFTECARRDSQDIRALNNLGILNALTNDHPEAIANFRATLAIDSANAVVQHNLRRTLDLAASKTLSVTPPSLAAYKALYDKDSTASDRTGWLFNVPLELLKKIGELPPTRTFEVSSQWIEDRACLTCRGTSKLPCPVCHGHGAVSETGNARVGTDLLGAARTAKTNSSVNCPKCDGAGLVDCPNCSKGIDRALQ